MKRSLIALLLCATVLVSTALPVFAVETSINAEHAISSISTNAQQYNGASAYKTGSIMSVGLSDFCTVDIQSKPNNQVMVDVSLSEETLTFRGKLYSIDGGGYYDDKMILGDFGTYQSYNISLFKIEKNGTNATIEILLEDIQTGILTELNFVITISEFEHLLDIATNTTAEAKEHAVNNGQDPRITVDSMILSLLRPSTQYVSRANADSLMRLQSSASFESVKSYSAVSVAYSTIDNFFNGFETSTRVSVSNSTMRNLLSQTGWKFYKTGTFFYVMHGVENSSTENLVGITVASISSEEVGEDHEILGDFYITDSYTLSYDTTLNTARVLYYNTGIRLEDALAAVEVPENTTNFYKADESYGMDGSNSVGDLLIGVAEDLGVPSTFFNVLRVAVVESRDESGFDYLGTDTAQINRYGSLILSVVAQANDDSYLWGEGDHLGIVGVYREEKPCSSFVFRYKFTGYSLL